MKITGLITEYNPFHNGHQYHMNKSREMTGADYTVVVMSGDFLQRGTPAVINKYERARMALTCGADLVLELPACYACASAEFFAFGGVSLLDGLVCVNDLVFGSEAEPEDLPMLHRAADVLEEEPSDFRFALQESLAKGLPFPQARSAALQACLQADDVLAELPENDRLAGLLSSPNNILGLEYLKALKRLNSPIQAYNLKRQGKGYHDVSMDNRDENMPDMSGNTFASATGIRHSLEQGMDLKHLAPTMPSSVIEILMQAEGRHFPVSEDDLSSLIHYKLLLSRGTYDAYTDISPELASRMEKLLPEYKDLSSFIDLLKSRNYTRTRISRCLMHLLLEMKTQELRPVPYARVLGFRKASSGVLSEIRKHAEIPLITKVADARNILRDWYTEDANALHYAQKMFAKDLFAADVYESIASQKFHTAPVNEYTHGVIIL